MPLNNSVLQMLTEQKGPTSDEFDLRAAVINSELQFAGV